MCVKCVEGVGILSQPAARLDPPLAATRVARPPFALALLQLHTLRAYRKRYEAVLPQLADLSCKVDAIRAWAKGRVAATTPTTPITAATSANGTGGGVTSAAALQQPGPPSSSSSSSELPPSQLLAEAVSGLASAMEERVRRSAHGGVSVGSGSGSGGRGGEGAPLALLSNTAGSSSGGGGGNGDSGSGGCDGNSILSLGLMMGNEAVRQAVRHLLQASPQQALVALAEVSRGEGGRAWGWWWWGGGGDS